MTFLTESEAVLPVDARGRVRVPAARREAILAEFAQSGMSARAFSQWAGINEKTFWGWLRRQRIAATSNPAMAPAAVLPAPIKPLQLFEAVSESALERDRPEGLRLELPGGVRFELTSSGQLPLAAELLQLLAAPRSRSC